MSIMTNENILSSPQVMWDEGELILLDYWTRSKTETCIDITAGNRRLTKKNAFLLLLLFAVAGCC